MKKYLIILLSLIGWQAVMALDPIYKGVFSTKAVSGYDVVAYFTTGKPTKGNDKYKYKWKDAEWFFASEENMKKFTSEPEKYAPQYGGYCAWAVAQGYDASGDPLQWTILNDKLYLNYDASVQKKWEVSREKFIADADKNWPNLIK